MITNSATSHSTARAGDVRTGHSHAPWRLRVVLLLAICGAASSVHGQDGKQLREQSAELYRQGKFAEAAHVAQRAVETDEQGGGADRPDTAASLLALATAYRGMGAFTKALPPAERAVAIREKALGPDAPETAAAVHTLSEVYRGLGNYPKALPLAQRALGIRERTVGLNHVDTAESRNDLGLLYFDMGNTSQAFDLLDQAYQVRTNLLPADDPAIAESLNNLAGVYWHQKMFGESLQRFERALAIKERAHGPDHPLLGTGHTNLAVLYLQMGKSAQVSADRDTFYKQALEHGVRAKAILQKADPKGEQLNTATALINLAHVLWQMAPATNDQVRDLFQQAAAIREKTLGPDHPTTVQALVLLAVFEQRIGKSKQALALFQRALPSEDRVLTNMIGVGSDEQQLALVDKAQGHYLAALSLVHRHFSNDPAAVRFGLEQVLRRKGIVLDIQARTQEVLAKHLGGAALESWRRLTAHRKALSKLLLDGPIGQSAAEYQQAVEKLQAAIQQEEQTVGSSSTLVAQELAQRQVTADAVAKRLPSDSVLVEFVRIRDWDAQRLAWSKTARYLAFTLTADNQVALVDLGDAAPIDEKIKATLKAINDPRAFDDPAAYMRKTDATLAEAYRVVLRPLDPTIGTRTTVIVSPDGELNRVPFPALRTSDGRYVVEQRTVSYVTSGRDLLRGKTGVSPTVNMALVANPAFDDKNVLSNNRSRDQAPARAGGTRGSFGALPGTAQEADAIQPLVQGTKEVLLGPAATEPAVREIKSPHVLHLATHGYFLPDVETAPADPLSRGDSGSTRGKTGDPLRRSGIALAGANYGYLEDCDEGILCAAEVESMDLHGTDLVVLSACETALGEVKVGEGVYGLRRAFFLAGARNLVMSLWPVDDAVTRDLMERFYKHYRNGVSVAAALRTAEVETIASLRSKPGEEGAMVNLWAPFIVQQSGE